MKRALQVLLIASAILAAPQPVAADPPGPTDYRTEIVTVEPGIDADAATLTVEGGDAFLQLAVKPGTSAAVPGYDGEPYLRFDPDGTVWENQRSESKWYNEERYGGELPPQADNNAAPEWDQVADDGVYAWHDHRAHWMSQDRLIGLEPGDSLAQQRLDIVVDGVPNVVVVETTLLAEPSSTGTVVGIGVGLLAAGLLVVFPLKIVSLLAVAMASLTVLAGAGQYFAVPSTTGPSWTWLVIPLMAFGCATIAALLRRQHFARPVLLAGTGGILILWAVRRVEILTAAYIPSLLDPTLDRMTTAAVGIGAIGLAVVALRLTNFRSPRRSPR